MIDGLPPIADTDIAALEAIMGLDFSDNARKEILRSIRSIDVQACPGSGKTTLVAAKLILLSKIWPFRHRGVCALTHTNVAKNEIIECLLSSPTLEAQSLLKYPHFIGTIQEFVNRFLALPYLRSDSHSGIVVDNEQYAEIGLEMLSRNEYFANRICGVYGDEAKRRTFLNSTFLILQDGQLFPNLAALPNRWQNQANYDRARNGFFQLKRRLVTRSTFLYRDMYSYAQFALLRAPNLSRSIAHRFPILILDEMQDTQKYQDDLLHAAFATQSEFGSILQRFGDPDQAIFHGVGGEEPNESFNAKTRDRMDYVLDGSHRYGIDIANKVRPFSLNEIELNTSVSADTIERRRTLHSHGGDFEHTIFVFDDQSQARVVSAFCELISNQFSEDYRSNSNFVSKIVGAVGKDVDPDQAQLRIGHYWPIYKKSKSGSSAKFITLYETVHYARNLQWRDANIAYQIVLKGVLTLLDLANVRDSDTRNFRVSTLKTFLIENSHWEPFRRLVYLLLSPAFNDSEHHWTIVQQKLGEWFDLENLGDHAQVFFNFAVLIEPEALDAEDEGSPYVIHEDNSFSFNGEFRVQLSTIHSIKGETHDATLVLETKYNNFDVGGMVKHFTGDRPDPDNTNHNIRENPHHSRGNAASKKFLRQFFVAMSRPKHLLCIAIHKDRLNDEDRHGLLGAGWAISDVFEDSNRVD